MKKQNKNNVGKDLSIVTLTLKDMQELNGGIQDCRCPRLKELLNRFKGL